MRLNEKESYEVETVEVEKEVRLEELSVLQLALVGGGVGEVIFG